MTPQDVKKRVEIIRVVACKDKDDEAAHMLEDKLHHDILASIRDGTIVDAVRCCEEALATVNIDFARWSA